MSDTCPTCGSDRRKFRHMVMLGAELHEGARYCPDPFHDQPDTDAVEAADKRLRLYQFQRNSGAPSLNKGSHGQTREQQIMSDLLDLAEFYRAELTQVKRVAEAGEILADMASASWSDEAIEQSREVHHLAAHDATEVRR